jgi:hypothetical protein
MTFDTDIWNVVYNDYLCVLFDRQGHKRQPERILQYQERLIRYKAVSGKSLRWIFRKSYSAIIRWKCNYDICLHQEGQNYWIQIGKNVKLFLCLTKH